MEQSRFYTTRNHSLSCQESAGRSSGTPATKQVMGILGVQDRLTLTLWQGSQPGRQQLLQEALWR